MSTISPSRRIKQRPVRVLGVVLAVLGLVNVKVFHGGIDGELIVIIAPIIAALITERFTFSQSFMRRVVQIVNEYGGNREGLGDRIARQDPRLNDGTKAAGTNYLRLRDGGITTLGALVIVVIILLFLLILVPGLGRR